MHAPEPSDCETHHSSSGGISGPPGESDYPSPELHSGSWGTSGQHPQAVTSTLDKQQKTNDSTTRKTFHSAGICAKTVADDSRSDVTVTAADAQVRGSRFVGDMNPEGIFFLEANPENYRSKSAFQSVGFWMSEDSERPGRLTGKFATPPPLSLLYGFEPTIQRAILPILAEECFSTIPRHEHRDALVAAYFEKIHPLFPIVNKSTYDLLSLDSLPRLLLDQGMCLAISMDVSTKDHLYLSAEPVALPFKDFGRRLLAAMRMIIEMGWVADKVLLIQLLSLMSLSREGPEGCEYSTVALGCAVHYLFSLGFHLAVERDDSQKFPETLFCSVWLLDRLNAASQGRPTLIHERDVGRSIQRSAETQGPPLRLLLHVGLLLDEVIKLYRPGCIEMEFTSDFHLFEDLAIKTNATSLPPHLLGEFNSVIRLDSAGSGMLTSSLATIEVLYHAVAILSCRPLTNKTTAPQFFSSGRTRQLWSAERVTALVGREFEGQLILLPFVPYAVSLSMSVNYRELRRSKVPAYRAKARNDLEINCALLERLGETFWSAKAMADTASVTLAELDRVFTHVKDDERRKDPSRSQGEIDTRK